MLHLKNFLADFTRLTIFVLVLKQSSAHAAELPFPSEREALETVEYEPLGMFEFGERLGFLVPKRTFFLHLAWQESGKERLDRFGKLLDQVRQRITQSPVGATWVGGWHRGGQIVLLDGAELNTVALGDQTFDEKTYRSIPWESVTRPGRDRGGEAPRPEVVALQARFKREFLDVSPLRFIGAMALNRELGTKGKRKGASQIQGVSSSFSVVVGTRLPSFPLVILSCKVVDPSACLVARACGVKGMKANVGDRSGLAYHEPSQMAIIGDRKRNLLTFLKVRSCLDTQVFSEIALPKQLKTVSMVHVDDAERLWVGSSHPDDYNNASVYFWKPEVWKPLAGIRATP